MALTKVIGAGVGSLTEDLALSDSDKIKLGAGSDLQLYHDGSHSYIDEVGTGSLYVRASIIRWTNADGSETLGGVDADGGWFLKANNSNALVIDTNGHVTKPLQSAFHGTPSAALENFAINSYNNVNFATERFDRNADYNAGGSPSAFTAPVTGVYQLNFHLYLIHLDTAADYVQFSIKTSNKEYVTIIDPNFSGDLTYYHMTMSVLGDMDANDTAYVRMYQSGGTAQLDVATNSSFSGYLVA